jgi:hypothetical protein
LAVAFAQSANHFLGTHGTASLLVVNPVPRSAWANLGVENCWTLPSCHVALKV